MPGVLSDRTNAFGHFLGGLAGEDGALEPAGQGWTHAGFVSGPRRAVAWRLLDAQYFRLAQRRRRCFVVAGARDGVDPAAILFESDGARRDTAPGREAGQAPAAAAGAGAARNRVADRTLRSGIAGTLSSRTTGGGGLGTGFDLAGGLQPVVRAGRRRGRGGDSPPDERQVPVWPHLEVGKRTGASANTPRAGLGVGAAGAPMFTPQASARHGVAVGAYAFQPRLARNGRGDMGELVNALTAQAGQSGRGDAAPCVALAFKASHYTRGKDGAPCVICPPLPADADRGDQDPLICIAPVIGFSCKDDGTGAQMGVSPTLRAMGHQASRANAGGQLAIAFAENTRGELRLEGGDGARTGALSAGGGKPGQGMPAVVEGLAVRRLTPRECERLQGFPDDWTLVPYRGRQAADGPRYRALGNAMAVPCMAFIGRRIQRVLGGGKISRENDQNLPMGKPLNR